MRPFNEQRKPSSAVERFISLVVASRGDFLVPLTATLQRVTFTPVVPWIAPVSHLAFNVPRR